ncbi:MAG: FadR family transcriptional regulator [Rubrivivax sp.]|jgi:DNA-binding FadR family transcriptional regulator|nr:FadR family transcriptional regulator [Rubrivivax sp.]
MPLHTIEPKRLYRQIADQVRALVEQGEFPRGARLPAERELAQQLGVSRPSVREALIALEVEGLVEVRMGSGIYVRDQAAAARAAPVTAEPPLETIRAREVIECELAARAALAMKAPQVRGLREAIALMQQEAAQGQMPTQGDRLFHVRIVEAAGNAVLTRVVTGLYDERHNPLFAQLGSHFENAASWQLAIAEHQAVVDAIAAHDADAARAAMSRHLTQSHDRFTASWQQPAAAPRGPRRKETTP